MFLEIVLVLGFIIALLLTLCVVLVTGIMVAEYRRELKSNDEDERP